MNKNRNLLFFLPHIFLIVLFFVIFIVLYFLSFQFSYLLTDIHLYKSIADNIMMGFIPYIDFDFEYPLLASYIFLLPRIFSKDITSYFYIFSFFNFVIVFFTSFASMKILKLYKKDINFKTIIYQIIFIFIFLWLLLLRYDIYPVFFVVLGIYFYLLSYKKQKYTHHVLSYIFVILAGFLKLYPFLLLPVMFISDIRQKNINIFLKSYFYSFLFFVLNIIFLFFGRDGVFYFFNFHSNRGLQIESFYSSIILFLSKTNIISGIEIINDGACWIISGSFLEFISKISLYIFLFFYIVILYFIYKKNDWSENLSKNIIFSFSIVTLTYILLNKVFSPQYLIWLFPFIFLLDTFSHRKNNFVSKIFLFIIFLTIIIFPFYYANLVSFGYVSIILLLIRNVLLFVILLRILYDFFINKK
ncbi:MAG: hypothetical protein PHZ07_01195 [Patescibacteria group bacterium]|nr:hypothetical protein [Patescibacteria group bacterium]MDD4303947.1 hypothetical protein [Patescibacteria group bacterium]MDD4695065.1 hypothetical protein [Patescibacteria group bacterium]